MDRKPGSRNEKNCRWEFLMADTPESSPLPTQKEFLEEVRQVCKDWDWENPVDPSFMIGGIIQSMIEKDMAISYQSLVSEFYFLRAEGVVLKGRDPKAWQRRLLGED